VIIDDAGIAAGNRDFLTQSNKNMSAILQVCRTKRWFMIYNMPNRRHVDLQIRELVYAKASIYKSFHSAGFNVAKIHTETINTYGKSGKDYRHRLHLGEGNKPISFYGLYSPELLDPYKGLMERYDILRDEATDALIHERAGQEQLKKQPVDKKKARTEKLQKEYLDRTNPHINTMKELIAGNNFKRYVFMAQTGLRYNETARMEEELRTGVR